MARWRELGPIGDVRIEHVPRSELLRAAIEEIEFDLPPDVASGQSSVLRLLELAPPSFDITSATIQLMEGQLAGLYRPSHRHVLVARDLRVDEQRWTLFHELGHALVDQHFDLEAKVAYRPAAGDQVAAIYALAEGDALSVMFDAMAAESVQARAPIVAAYLARLDALTQHLPAGIPMVLARTLTSPYRDGLRFVEALREQGGWAAVDAVWRKPPSSTEQILHPEKYFDDEGPGVVSRPPSPAPECRIVYEDVLGEQSIRAVLEEWNPYDIAASASMGWHGDRVAVYDCGETQQLRWTIVYDDEAAAAGAENAFRASAQPDFCGLRAVTEPRPPSVQRRGTRLEIEAPGQGCHAK